MKFKFLVYRQENIRPDPIVLVTAETVDQIDTERKLIAALKLGVEKWAQQTPEGQRMYEYAEDDMNIGDIEGDIDEILPLCEGILSLSFESLDIAKEWVYDTSLCDEIEDDEVEVV